MKIITERDQIRQVAEMWDKQYSGAGHGADKYAISSRLRALNLEQATRKQVEAIIGNSSWTTSSCCECEKYVSTFVVLSYYSSSVNICFRCVQKLARRVARKSK